jgi:hypothetical protein
MAWSVLTQGIAAAHRLDGYRGRTGGPKGLAARKATGMATRAAPCASYIQHLRKEEPVSIAATPVTGAITPHKNRLRLKIGVALAAALVALGSSMMFAPAASANAKSNWSEVVDGVEIGWTQNHAWAIASYAALIKVGASKAATLACDALIKEEEIGSACGNVIGNYVKTLMKGEKAVTSNGVWVALYPATGWQVLSLRFTYNGGRY